MTRGFHKQHSGANLGSHAALGEVTFSQILLGLGHCDGVQSLLVFLAEIDVDLRHIGEDVELVGANLDGSHGGSQVLVDDRLNAHMHAVLLDDRDTTATNSDDDIALVGQTLHQFNILNVNRFWRGNHLAPAFAFRVFLVDGTRFGGVFFGLFLGVIRSNRLGGILEHRVVLVDEHLCHEGNHVAVDVFLHHHLFEPHLNHVADLALGLGTTHVHRHSRQPKLLQTSLILEQHIAHLRTVAVADDQIITLFQERQQRLASVGHILHLFLACTFLTASQKGVSAESDNSQFLHYSLFKI